MIVELAPKVLDGTRCNIESLDMCISGICQVCQYCLSKTSFDERHFFSFIREYSGTMEGTFVWVLHIKLFCSVLVYLYTLEHSY